MALLVCLGLMAIGSAAAQQQPAGAPVQSQSDDAQPPVDAIQPGPPAASREAPAGSPMSAAVPQAGPAAASASPVSLTLPKDLSPWGMFMDADIVVKAVMLGLAFASLVTWTVWLVKTIELAGARLRARACSCASIAARQR